MPEVYGLEMAWAGRRSTNKPQSGRLAAQF